MQIFNWWNQATENCNNSKLSCKFWRGNHNNGACALKFLNNCVTALNSAVMLCNMVIFIPINSMGKEIVLMIEYSLIMNLG